MGTQIIRLDGITGGSILDSELQEVYYENGLMKEILRIDFGHAVLNLPVKTQTVYERNQI